MAVCINEIWEEFSLPLKRFISRRISNPQDVDDVLQNIFIKIDNNADSLMDDTKIYAWIYRITRNAIVDYYRKKEPIEFVELPDNLANENEEDLSFNGEIAACLRKMIDSLPEKNKKVILLAEFENLTQKEISDQMGLSLSATKSRIQRGRQKLKEMLLGCCQLEFDRMGNIIDYKHKSSKCKYC